MIIDRPNPEQIVLQVVANNLDGTPKTSLSSATVRVYAVNSVGAEVEELPTTSLGHVGTSNVWRLVWEPTALPAGQYFAEYALTDTDGVSFLDNEDVVIQDFALQADVEFLKQVESGKWEILNNQMVFFDVNGDELLRFNLFDIDGIPTNGVNMFKREPV